MSDIERPKEEKIENYSIYGTIPGSFTGLHQSASSFSQDPIFPTIEPSQPRSFGNSARFYKALKDYQQTSDVNILKEELWTSRKEITTLEKKVLEQSQEIYELKKLSQSNLNTSRTEDLKKSLDKEIYFKKKTEQENLSLKDAIEKLQISCENKQRALDRAQSLIEFYLKKNFFEYEDCLRKISNKVNEYDYKISQAVEVFRFNKQLEVKVDHKEKSGNESKDLYMQLGLLKEEMIKIDELNKRLEKFL